MRFKAEVSIFAQATEILRWRLGLISCLSKLKLISSQGYSLCYEKLTVEQSEFSMTGS